MNLLLRFLGVLLPILAGIVVAGPPFGITTSAEFAESMAMRFALGVVGGLLLQSWWAIAIVPILYIVTYWIAREFTCPECSGPTYDVGILGAIVYGFIDLIPYDAWRRSRHSDRPSAGEMAGALISRSIKKWQQHSDWRLRS